MGGGQELGKELELEEERGDDSTSYVALAQTSKTSHLHTLSSGVGQSLHQPASQVVLPRGGGITNASVPGCRGRSGSSRRPVCEGGGGRGGG